MKHFISLFIISLLISCDKDGDQTLPPATQTGERTFGCLVDGKVFVHNDGIINCFYQLIDGEYNFGIQGRNGNRSPSSVTLGTYKKSIAEGETYQLSELAFFNAWASSFFPITSTSGEVVSTTLINGGELSITKLDFTNNIVSGTFWYNVQHPVTGEVVHITEGRFDTYFTQ